ncbi:MAG: glycosyltransferase [Clostridia bacterium]|nr:glycosyltransferase [Clostridia bacterium]
MVILHIASIETTVLGGVNIAVPRMAKAQKNYASVGLVNLTGTSIPGIPTFSVTDVYEKKLPSPFQNPDLVVFHEVYRPAFLKLARLFRKNRTAYIVIPHGCLTKTAQRQKFLKKQIANFLLFRSFLEGACAIQYLSEREESQSGFSCPSFVAENGVPLPQKTKEMPSKHGIHLVYIGRLDWHIKGLDLLLLAIAENHQWFLANNITLSLYGPDSSGEHQKIYQFLENHKLFDCVTLHREVTGLQKENTLLSADYLIQTSRSEGMPMGLLEALSYGLPAIVTEGTGFAGILSEANCGYGCQTTSEGIFAAIAKAMQNHSQYQTLSKNARNLIATTLEENLITQKTVSYYETLLNAPAK